MKKGILLVSIVFTLFGCKKEEVNEFPFDSFILSGSGLRQDNSIKITKSDTVYFQRRFPEPKENFYAVLNKHQKTKLENFFKSLNFNQFSTYYQQENIADGGSLQFEILNNNKRKIIFIYGGTAPDKLYDCDHFLREFQKELTFIKTIKPIYFGDQGPIFDRPPLPPPLKNK